MRKSAEKRWTENFRFAPNEKNPVRSGFAVYRVLLWLRYLADADEGVRSINTKRGLKILVYAGSADD